MDNTMDIIMANVNSLITQSTGATSPTPPVNNNDEKC